MSTIRDEVGSVSHGVGHALSAAHKLCDDVGVAVDTGNLGDIVSKHEKLILKYYKDVQDEAKQSFRSARMVAQYGFWILVGTLTYALIFDALTRFGRVTPPTGDMSMTIAKLGVISGALIEFVAGIQFWLYARAARQFGAFHICLERTHRYLLAYKISEKIEGGRDDTLHELVCIMANAPMIGRAEGDPASERSTSDAHLSAVSAELTQASTK